MKAMDGDCATGPWRERPGLVTLTHARDPIEWQTTLYYYAGAGSKLVAPDRGATLGGMALCPTLLVISNGWLIAC